VLGCSSPRGGGGGGGGGRDTGAGGDEDSGIVRPPPSEGACEKMDILVVIDDSGSMAEEQGNLATNFPRFVEVLDAYLNTDGVPLDYRIGVTTTGRPTTVRITFPPMFPIPPMEMMENGPNGELLMSSSCGMSRRWIERVDPDVAGTFSCIANVGTMGSSIEMPLLMTQRAVTDRVADGTNEGFLRPDALLAVVILTDENDCSRTDDPIEIMVPDPFSMPGAAVDECDPSAPELTPVASIVSALDGVKGDRGRWAVAMIAGPGPGDCMSGFGSAVEATRLRDFHGMVGTNAVFSSICEGDLATALMEALDTFEAACQSFPPLI
jgi:hypothetical protein